MLLDSALPMGDLSLSHRMVLAPLTRMRANHDTLAHDDASLAATYYAQRATPGGLLISEATLVSSEGLLDHNVPGIWSPEQTRCWTQVVDAVHAKGALFSCQLWHTGRNAHATFAAHPAMQAGRVPTVSASDVRTPGQTRSTYTGDKLDTSVPRPLRADEMGRVAEDYRLAAVNAKAAGFDAVEVHGAHGYLLDQFLNNGVNRRTDAYGGSVENRMRLLLEVLAAVATVYPNSRIGVRISPHHEGSMKYYGTEDSDPDALYAAVIKRLDKLDLAYLLLTEPRWFGGAFDKDHATDPGFKMALVNPAKFRKLYRGCIIGAGGFTPASAEQALKDGDYDAIAFGRWFISNPDLPDRIRNGQPLTPYVRKLFYAHTAEGYTDYPVFDAVADKSALVPQTSIGQSLSAPAKL